MLLKVLGTINMCEFSVLLPKKTMFGGGQLIYTVNLQPHKLGLKPGNSE